MGRRPAIAPQCGVAKGHLPSCTATAACFGDAACHGLDKSPTLSPAVVWLWPCGQACETASTAAANASPLLRPARLSIITATREAATPTVRHAARQREPQTAGSKQQTTGSRQRRRWHPPRCEMPFAPTKCETLRLYFLRCRCSMGGRRLDDGGDEVTSGAKQAEGPRLHWCALRTCTATQQTLS